jgi:alkylated DNA repair dioxygenase AlkB
MDLNAMDLFDYSENNIENLLPEDGTVLYMGHIMPQTEADFYMERLLETIAWKNDEAVIFGKLIITKRKVAWYGDSNFSYTYSNRTKQALVWTPELLKLKALVEEKSGETYNSCLLNLYHNGQEGMSWHSDGEKDLKKNGAIASVSFGAARKFAFKHKKTKQTISLLLNHGSLLVMKDETQTHWLHRLPPTTLINSPRINLTFRTIILK